MSGGIDSTAAAMMLLEQGYQVVGCTFRTRYTKNESIARAVELARQLGITHHIVDYSEEFDAQVVHYFRAEYLAGRTPNPCVMCNRVIKFGALMEQANRWGCDKMATGHYARICGNHLCRAVDRAKDQTYFLWQVDAALYDHILFPLGEYTKEQIRAYLMEHGMTTLAQQGESQDICFIESDYRSFLNLPDQRGDYVDANGQVLGQHIGYTHYTIGQRKGLGIALGSPAFVTQIDAAANRVTLGSHDDLYTHEVRIRNWRFNGDASQPVMAQIRYRSVPTQAHWVWNEQQPDRAMLQFDEPVWAVTPGQSVVMYQEDILVGGGVIE